MAGKGVRVATGYIEISAETKDVPGQIKDALDKAGTAAKPAGEKIGKDLGTGIQSGIDIHKVGTQIGVDIHKGVNPKQTGQIIGKDLSGAIAQGAAVSQVGKKMSTDLRKGTDATNTGKKIGKELGESAGAIIKQEARAWAKNIATELKSGDIQGAASNVGTTVTNVTDTIYNLGRAVGVHLDAVKTFGNDTATVLGNVGTKGQEIAENFGAVATGLSKIHEAGGAGKLQGIADTTQAFATAAKNLGINLGNTPDKIANIANSAAGVAATAGAIKELATQLKVAAAIMPVSGSVLALAGAILFGASASSANPNIGPGGQERIAKLEAGKKYGEKFGANNMPKGYQQWLEGKGPMPPEMAPFYTAPQAATGTVLGPPSGPWGGVGGSAEGPKAQGSSYEVAHQAMLAAGWGEEHWPALQSILTRESGGNPSARNPSSGAFGMFQFLGHENDKYAALGAYSSDPAAQSRAGMAYIRDRYGSPQAAWAFWQANGWYDEGGELPPGTTLATNTTGKPEQVLTSEQADQAKKALEFVRTAGFIPAASGQTGTVAGTSFLAGILNLGNEAVGGLIDMGASVAETAISMGIAAGVAGGGGAGMGAGAAAPLAGAAAGMASNYLIGLGATEAKRAVSYGFQLLSIGADALIEQAFPFGSPRWLGYDYTQFLPHVNIAQIGTTTAEKAITEAMKGTQSTAPGTPGASPGQPATAGGPVSPMQLPGAQPPGQPVPKFGEKPQVNQPGIPETGPKAVGVATGIGPEMATPPPSTPPPAAPITGINLGNLLGMDEGGWLPTDHLAYNTSGRPELVLSPSMLDSMAAMPPQNTSSGNVNIHAIYATDANDVGQQIARQQRLQMMRYAGRHS